MKAAALDNVRLEMQRFKGAVKRLEGEGARTLERIRTELPGGLGEYKLTFIGRVDGNQGADVLVTQEESLVPLRKLLSRCENREEI